MEDFPLPASEDHGKYIEEHCLSVHCLRIKHGEGEYISGDLGGQYIQICQMTRGYVSEAPLLLSKARNSSCIEVCVMSYTVAFMETFTISAFPYYTFENRSQAYTIGCLTRWLDYWMIGCWTMFFTHWSFCLTALNKLFMFIPLLWMIGWCGKRLLPKFENRDVEWALSCGSCACYNML